ncbi:hypothetical protein CHU98_g11656, partial [Xylaria longipes]
MSPTKEAVSTPNSPAPLPQFSQAIKYNGMVYCSGSIGKDPVTKELAKGGVQPETRVAIKNISAVLEAAGSSLDNIIKINIFLTTMDDFAAMNEAYDESFGSINPKPVVTLGDNGCLTVTGILLQCLMSLNAGARLVRVQPTRLHHAMQQRPSSVSGIPLGFALSLSQAHRYSRIASSRSIYPKNALQTQFRSASTSSASQPKTSAASFEKAPPTLPEPISDPLNPPASTRPPPLDLPVRDPSANLFMHLFRLGKAYTTFYKTGLKAVFTNRRLLRDLPDTPPPGLPTPATSVRGSASAATIAATTPLPNSALSRSLDKSANPT